MIQSSFATRPDDPNDGEARPPRFAVFVFLQIDSSMAVAPADPTVRNGRECARGMGSPFPVGRGGFDHGRAEVPDVEPRGQGCDRPFDRSKAAVDDRPPPGDRVARRASADDRRARSDRKRERAAVSGVSSPARRRDHPPANLHGHVGQPGGQGDDRPGAVPDLQYHPRRRQHRRRHRRQRVDDLSAFPGPDAANRGQHRESGHGDRHQHHLDHRRRPARDGLLRREGDPPDRLGLPRREWLHRPGRLAQRHGQRASLQIPLPRRVQPVARLHRDRPTRDGQRGVRHERLAVLRHYRVAHLHPRLPLHDLRPDRRRSRYSEPTDADLQEHHRRHDPGQPGDDHLGDLVAHQPRRRDPPRHHVGPSQRHGQHQRHGHRRHRRDQSHANLSGQRDPREHHEPRASFYRPLRPGAHNPARANRQIPDPRGIGHPE